MRSRSIGTSMRAMQVSTDSFKSVLAYYHAPYVAFPLNRYEIATWLATQLQSQVLIDDAWGLAKDTPPILTLDPANPASGRSVCLLETLCKHQ